MAEFQDVIRQAQRLCDYFNQNCENCERKYRTCIVSLPKEKTGIEMFEREILKWAEEHPEPRYPTWKEWWDENFNDAAVAIWVKPCMFMKKEKWEMESGLKCSSCRVCIDKPIPAEIAKKLGIKQKHIKE